MKDWRTVVGFILASLMILYMVYTAGHIRGYQACADWVVEDLRNKK